MKPQFLIGSTSSSGGKTIFTMGMLRLMKKRGMKVQPYKCGPDFTGPQLHGLAGGVESVNLDLWMADKTHIQYSYNKYGEAADVCIIEGNASLFDGYKRMQGSSAEISRLLSVPTVLVVDARSSAYSVAPMLYGYKHFCSDIKISGVVFINVSSSLHFSYLKDACDDAGLNCFGYIPYDDFLKLPSRHTAMTQTLKVEIDEVIEKAASYIESNVDVDKIIKSCSRIFPCKYTLPYTSDVELYESNLVNTKSKLRIAVARDAAFNFTYKENIDRLSAIGNIVFFSPLYGKDIPEADLIYFPGGFPELFARQLYRRKEFMQKLRNLADKDVRIIAEGGAMLLLCRSVTIREGGTAYEMSGILPFDCMVNKGGVISGYRSLSYNGIVLRGYESRYLSIDTYEESKSAEVCKSLGITSVVIENTRGAQSCTPLYRYKNVIGSFTHFYWSDIDLLQLW